MLPCWPTALVRLSNTLRQPDPKIITNQHGSVAIARMVPAASGARYSIYVRNGDYQIVDTDPAKTASQAD